MKKKLIIGLLSLGLLFAGAMGVFAATDSFTPDKGRPDTMKQPVSVERHDAVEQPVSVERHDAAKRATMLTAQEAKQIALDRVGGGKVIELELDRDDGRTYYELEIIANQREVEVEVDAYTGRILEVEWDDDVRKHTPSKRDIIDLNEAINIALNHVGDGVIEEVELDRDDGRIYYEIELETKRGEVEIEMDAYTGAILEVEWDD